MPVAEGSDDGSDDNEDEAGGEERKGGRGGRDDDDDDDDEETPKPTEPTNWTDKDTYPNLLKLLTAKPPHRHVPSVQQRQRSTSDSKTLATIYPVTFASDIA